MHKMLLTDFIMMRLSVLNDTLGYLTW